MGNRKAAIAAIHVGKARLRLDDEAYRALLFGVTGKRSAGELSESECGLVLDRMRDLGFEPSSGKKLRGKKPSGRPHVDGVTVLRTRDQMQLIEQLRKEVGGGFTREAYFAGVCKRVIGTMEPRTAAEASRVIEALKRRRDAGGRG